MHDSWTYEGTAVQAYDIIYRDDLQYLWLPAQPRLRQGADRHAAQGRVRLGRRRPRRQDRGEPRRRAAHLHGRGAADLREGPVPGHGHGRHRGSRPRSSPGPSPSAARPLRPGWPGRSPRVCSDCSSRSPTGWSTARSRTRMGGRIRFFVSGSAALNREVQEWFYATDLLVLEGYGLTETTAASCVNNPRATRFGTVGTGPARHPGQARRGRGDPDQEPGSDARLPRDRRRRWSGRAGGPPAGRLAGHRRYRDPGRGGLSADHRPQEGPDQDLRRQVRRAAEGRGNPEGCGAPTSAR